MAVAPPFSWLLDFGLCRRGILSGCPVLLDRNRGSDSSDSGRPVPLDQMGGGGPVPDDRFFGLQALLPFCEPRL